MPLLDAGLRGALIALLLLAALRFACDRFEAPAARVGVLLLLCLVVQTIASSPFMEKSGPWWWQAPLVAVSVGNSVLFWLFARSLFDDGFRWHPAHLALWGTVMAWGLLFFAVVVMPQQRQLAGFALAVAVAMRWIPIVFAVLAVVAVAFQWRADLVERRRWLRGFILSAGALYTVVMAVARMASGDGRLTAWMAGVDVVLLLIIVGTLAARELRVTSTALFPAPAVLPPPKAASQSPSAASPGDEGPASELHRLMTDKKVYRSADLSVASLAALLKIPEYRLRRVINGQLGHRNFNAYINSFRLAEAKMALADPRRRDLPVLTIALEAGFQSIGPFNRAFKATTGSTPTEFRRQNLADF